MWFEVYNTFLYMLWNNPETVWLALLFIAAGMPWITWVFIP